MERSKRTTTRIGHLQTKKSKKKKQKEEEEEEKRKDTTLRIFLVKQYIKSY